MVALAEPVVNQARTPHARARFAPALLGYGRGGNRPCDIARIRCDCLVRIEPGSDALLLGKAFFVVAGARVADSFFLIERCRLLADDTALADW